MIWWVENPKRSATEREAIANLSQESGWLTIVGVRLEGLQLAWDVDLQTSERVYPLSIRYPDHFPHSPPVVIPRGVTERWSGHQYGAGGELCLEFGPDNWHRDLTGADMLSSAYRLLSGEEAFEAGAGDVASRHRSSLGQTLRSQSNRFFVPFSAQAFLADLGIGASLHARVIPVFRKKRTTLFLKSVGSEEERWEGEPPEELAEITFDLTCRIVRVAELERLPKPGDSDQFRAEWLQHGRDLEGIQVLLVLQGAKYFAFDLFYKGKATLSTVLLEEEKVKRLSHEMGVLSEKSVSIVGNGSLGSKIASILARHGIQNFVLVDDDVFLPENLVRNDLDWRDVGQHKAEAVADRIGLIQPGAKVKAFRRSLGGQEASSDIEAVISAVAATDLLIDVTADPSAFNYLCSVQEFAKKPLLWGEVFGGGFGGLIARSRPEIDPDASTMRNRILAWCFEHGRSIPPALGRYEGAGKIPEIAGDAEVTVIAGQLALMAVDTLIPRSASAYPYAAYLIGFRAEWIFEAPFDTRPIDVGEPEQQTSASSTDEERQAEVLKLVKLLGTQE
jgi:sulfur-carrier protein adenylyltransferase/sulfurtransferase